MNGLNKYKIGLSVIGALSLILLVVVVVQAGAAKQDEETFEKADKIASKLQDYTYTKGIPDSLEDAGIVNVPDEVSYEKLSEEKYKFCVTYKTKSSGFDSNEIWYTVATGGAASSPYDTGEDEETSYLYLSSYHDKGENCQTVHDEYASRLNEYEDYEYDEDYNFDELEYQEQ